MSETPVTAAGSETLAAAGDEGRGGPEEEEREAGPVTRSSSLPSSSSLEQPQLRLCANGCERPAFRTFATCCTHCRGMNGPHARDCATKACYKSLGDFAGSGVVVVRIIKAELFRSFDSVGLMDPFAIAEFLPSGSDDKKVEIGRTRSAWQAHMHPVWDHMCRGAIYRGPRSGDKLRLRVMEENFGGFGNPTLCGEKVLKLQEILADVVDVSAGVKTSRQHELTLEKKGEPTGLITVQAVLYSSKFHRVSTCDISALTGMEGYMTVVDPDLFETPVKRLGVSGGTAPFFALKLRNPEAGQSESHWIGKDLSRATDEIAFYEHRMGLMKGGSHGMDGLFGFMFDYAGVLECAEEGAAPGAPKLQLLVLRNLRDGCKKFRMLDIKMGDKTAVAGWQGKSWFAAMRNSVVDGLTNSQAEGFRLEGFDGQPPALASMDPLIDFGGVKMHSKGMSKKAQRMMLQRMPASVMFAHFMDLHQDLGDVEDINATLTAAELGDIVMGEITSQLVRLTMACKGAAVPQKWIGSSVALGFDAGHLPSRATPVEEIAKTVRVQIFDWGRSELNTLSQHTAMPAQDQADRREFFRLYSAGMSRLAWEAARYCWHHFCNDVGWSELRIQVFDFDSHSSNDFIGQVSVQLQECGNTTELLQDESGNTVKGKAGPSTISYAISWQPLPEGSRLAGAWRVQLLRAQNLPGMDGMKDQTSDPFVSILAQSPDGQFRCGQSSCVVPRNLNPTWNETFEFPVASTSARSADASRSMVKQLLDAAGQQVSSVLPPAAGLTSPQQDHNTARVLWKQTLDKACGRRSFCWT